MLPSLRIVSSDLSSPGLAGCPDPATKRAALTVLVVDDDQVCRYSLRHTLQSMGHTVVDLDNGQEALGVCRQLAPDAVLLDMHMPDFDGIELLMALRREIPGLPVIAMSGGGRSSAGTVLQSARVLGAAHILAKPFSADELNCAFAAIVRRTAG